MTLQQLTEQVKSLERRVQDLCQDLERLALLVNRLELRLRQQEKR